MPNTKLEGGPLTARGKTCECKRGTFVQYYSSRSGEARELGVTVGVQVEAGEVFAVVSVGHSCRLTIKVPPVPALERTRGTSRSTVRT